MGINSMINLPDFTKAFEYEFLSKLREHSP